MRKRHGHLTDPFSTLIAAFDVTRSGDLYSGTICLDATPPELGRLFQEFEEMVEGQVFSVADEIEEKIARLRLRVVFAGGEGAEVADLHVYPNTNAVTFKIRRPATVR